MKQMLADEVHYCPRCGEKLVKHRVMEKSRPVCEACGWVYFADPKVATAVLIVEDGKVLLVKRKNSPKQGYWTLPAGFVDAGEDPRDAAVRECLEETGYQVKVIRLIDVIAGQEHSRGAHILILYQGEILGGTQNAGDDAAEVDFFALDDLPPLAFRATETAISIAKTLII